MKIGDKVRVIKGVHYPAQMNTAFTVVSQREVVGEGGWYADTAEGYRYAFAEGELELMEEPMKKLDIKKVKAVGGCQHDALVALLKEMGYEVAAPANNVARPGMIVYFGNSKRIVVSLSVIDQKKKDLVWHGTIPTIVLEA